MAAFEGIPATADLTKADFVSDQTVRWCPGCGDYAILSGVQKLMPQLGIEKEKMVFVSGIGCSSRFPYYMNTYGFHTLHGRAPALATGIKLANPDLSVWIVTGDGDALSIGGNHLLHILRRNLDVNILLVNNQIYGLTKGQYSPTSLPGKVTKSSPAGSIEEAVNPIAFAAAAGATFIARCLDTDVKELQRCLHAAASHKGTSFVEIYQNCNIFNDGAFSKISDRKESAETTVRLEEGKPLVFGKERNKALVFDNMSPKIVELENELEAKKLPVHDSTAGSAYTYLLSQLTYPDFPVPMGIFRQESKPTYEDQSEQQIADYTKKHGTGDIKQLLEGNDTWQV